MGKLITFKTTQFRPTPDELDENHDNYINPGAFARELSDFIAAELKARGIETMAAIVEDWGHWVEVEHDKDFALAICCGNQGEDEHLVYVDPTKAFVRKWFKKIPVQDDVDQLFNTVQDILEKADGISDVTVEDE